MSATRLNTLIVAGEPGDAELAQRVLQDNGDEASRCSDVPEALSRMAQEPFDLALVSLSMPRGDGLALVHHLRALYPDVDVVAMAGRDEMEEMGSAMALGVLTTLVTPLTGDDVLVAADRARERRVLIERASQQPLIERSAPSDVPQAAELYRRCEVFVGEADPKRILHGLLDLCRAEIGPCGMAAYLPAGSEGGLERQPLGESFAGLPEQVDGVGVEQSLAADPVRIHGGQLQLLLRGPGGPSGALIAQLESPALLSDAQLASLRVAAQLAAAALAGAGRTRAIASGGIRDADTGAYTFAYFGDVAARELDRAVRHQRAFALLTLSLGIDLPQMSSRVGSEVLRLLAQPVLATVRGSDVVARRDADTFYLLLPETGLLGALACRRRVFETMEHTLAGDGPDAVRIRELLGSHSLQPSTGISVYPGDGPDLGELIKLSQRRAARARDGLWKRLGLDGMGFWEVFDRLTGDDPAVANELARDTGGLSGRVDLPQELAARIAEGLVRDAAREGLSGALYLAGDADFTALVARAVDAADSLPMRTWMLGPSRSVRDPAARIRLPLTDSRLGRAHLVLAVCERGGYCLLGRTGEASSLQGFHTSELEIVEGLVSALQREYHLQPELK